LSADQVKLIIPHQVNQRIIDSAMQRLNLPPEKAFVNIDRYGNTSAASIPIALDEAVRGGRAGKGDIVIFVAFGGGLTWANAVVRM
jgi:3-oxoacyl-[acyl-carrier-protein] synthase-3